MHDLLGLRHTEMALNWLSAKNWLSYRMAMNWLSAKYVCQCMCQGLG